MIKKKIFVHTFEIFDADLLVCIGIEKVEEIQAWFKKQKRKELHTLLTKEDTDTIQNVLNSAAGMVYQKSDKENKNFHILWLKSYTNSWQEITILVHELVHYKQFQFKNKYIKDEDEFEAYFVESCVMSLQSKLQKELRLNIK